jgi:hypothetical protein
MLPSHKLFMNQNVKFWQRIVLVLSLRPIELLEAAQLDH